MFNKNDNPYDDSKSINKGLLKLPDGRELTSEVWAECGYTFLTYIVPCKGIENHTKEELVNYLILQGIKISKERFPMDRISVMKQRGTSNEEQFNLTITIGDGD